MNKFWTAALAVLCAIVFIVWAVTVNGFVLSTLWRWFVVPVFSVPAISVPQAIGIWCVIAYVRSKPRDSEKTKSDAPLRDAVMYLVFCPVVSLLVGWVVHHWVTP